MNEELLKSLNIFKRRRDALLDADSASFTHQLKMFINFCETNSLINQIISPVIEKFPFNMDEWWSSFSKAHRLDFPDNIEEEFSLRFHILNSVLTTDQYLYEFLYSGRERSDRINYFLKVVFRPFAEELSDRVADEVNLASPEEQSLQAVPLKRIPKENEIKIFLSHKSADKNIVQRYYNALVEIGYKPWLDEDAMAAGDNLERSILEGFKQSCAAIFFITENFEDKDYLATEVDYAIKQKRNKKNKFAIITLKYPGDSKVPDLLDTYVYKVVNNDLEGFYEVIRALPIELGPCRWKEKIVD